MKSTSKKQAKNSVPRLVYWTRAEAAAVEATAAAHGLPMSTYVRVVVLAHVRNGGVLEIVKSEKAKP